MRAEGHRVHLALALVGDVGLDQVGGEDVPLEQEVVVGLQGVEDLGQRPGEILDLGGFLTLQLIEVGLDRLGRLDLVGDTVQTRHQHGAECEVRVAGRVGGAELQAPRLGRIAVGRDPDAGATVARAIRELDRCLVAGNQTAVGVGGRRDKREQCRSVLEQPADVPATEIAEQRVAVLVVEERDASLPERLVNVHPAAVVTEQRLGHEGRGIAVLGADVLDNVLELQNVVGHRGQGAEPHVDLGLPCGADLVVVHLDVQTGLEHLQDDAAAQVLQLVRRRDGEVPLFVLRPVAEVGALTAAVPDALIGIDVVVALVGVLVEAD